MQELKPLGYAIKFVIIVTIYSAIGIAILTTHSTVNPFSTFWLPIGIGIGLISRWGFKLLPAVFLGSLLTNAYGGLAIGENFGVSTGSTVGAAAFFGIFWLRNIDLGEIFARENTVLFFISTLLTMLIPAAVTAVLLNMESINWFIFYAVLISTCSGLLIGGKFVFELNIRNVMEALRDAYDALLLIVSLGLVLLVYYSLVDHITYVFDYICFIFLTALSLKHGPLLSRFAAILLIFVANLESAFDKGVYSILNEYDGNVYLLSAIACITLLGFFTTNAREDSVRFNLEAERLKKDKEKQQKYLKAVIHSIPDLLIEVDKTSNCLAVNGSSPVLKFSASELVGKRLKDVLSEEAYVIWIKAVTEAADWNFSQGKVIEIYEENRKYSFELSITKRAGEVSTDDTFICIARDITKRLAEHNADLANEKRFREIFDNVENISVQGYNRFHEVIYWNKASEVLYGYTEEEAKNRKLEDLIIPAHMRLGVYNDIEAWHKDDIAIPAGELTLKGKKGDAVFVYSNHIMIRTANDKEMFCLDIDIGEQRRSLAKAAEEISHRRLIENNLLERDRTFRRAQTMGNIAHWNWFPSSDIYTINEIVLQFLQFPKEDLTGTMADFILVYVKEDGREKLTSAFQECIDGKQDLEVEVTIAVHERTYLFMLKGEKVTVNGETSLDGIIHTKEIQS